MPEQAPAKGGGIGATLTRKVGPLPMWAYAVIGGGVGFLYLRHRSSTANPQTAAASGFAGGTTASQGTYAGAGDNAGGADSSSTDAQLQTLGQQIGSLSAAQAGIAQSIGQPATGSVGGALSGISQQITALPSVIQPQPAQAPVTSPAAATPPKLTVRSDPSWTAGGGGEVYLPAWNYYGAGKGVGVNEISTYLKTLGYSITPAQLSAWNKGAQFFGGPGQPTQIYVGSLADFSRQHVAA